MSTADTSGLYLIVEFDWPNEITSELFKASAHLHEVVTKSDWIDEKVAGYGGLRLDFQCIWIFRVKDYAALDKLLNLPGDKQDDVAKAYSYFFDNMIKVKETIRQEVTFR
ncbi:MAG: hypothetical protein ACW98K_02860 [Candidatus Kariarchaeaceae archaeon]|jgi:hypothetical protein